MNQQYLPTYGGGLFIPGTALMDGDNLDLYTEVYSPFFEEFYGRGVDILGVPPSGAVWDAKTRMYVPRWIACFNDLLQFMQGSPGTGLVDEHYDPRRPNWLDPNEDTWIQSVRVDAFTAVRKFGIWTLLPRDIHLNPQLWNLNALTKYNIIMDRLHPDERQVVESDPILRRKAQSGERLTVGEYFKVLGGVVTDKEDDNFIPHARQGEVRYITSAQELLQWAASEAMTNKGNMPRPTPLVFSDHNTRLGLITPGDEFGMGGNNLYALLKAAFRGFYLDGKFHKGTKVAVLGGTTGEYKVRNFGVELFDQDFNVVWVMPWTGMLGADSLLHVVDEVVSLYSKKIMPTFDWPSEAHFGPKPQGFDQRATLVKAQMYLAEFGTQNTKVYDLFMRITQEAQAMVARGEDLPYAVGRLGRMLTETNFAGEKLFWSMPEIEQYLRTGVR